MENLNDIFVEIISVIVSSGIIIKFDDDLKLASIMKTLMQECIHNSTQDGSPQSPFQKEVLARALDTLEFREQYPKLADECSIIIELITNDLAPADVQQKLAEMAQKIDAILPDLETRTTSSRHVKWYILPEKK